MGCEDCLNWQELSNQNGFIRIGHCNLHKCYTNMDFDCNDNTNDIMAEPEIGI